MQRPCNAKIVATLGPASADRATIEALVRAGADVFRLNFSHGTHADHKQRLDLIRSIEADLGFDGLAAVVQTVLAETPFCGQVFVFRGPRGDSVSRLALDASEALSA
jgi:pyruvate kinase